MSKKTELQVSALKNGTVIDHIPQNHVMKVIDILKLNSFKDQIYIGANLESKKYGKKGIIKVSNKFFKDNEINKISLIAPTATLIEIRDFEVVRKTGVSIPDEIHGLLKCFNPKCITNFENTETQFTVLDKTQIKVKCHYCEKITKKEDMTFL